MTVSTFDWLTENAGITVLPCKVGMLGVGAFYPFEELLLISCNSMAVETVLVNSQRICMWLGGTAYDNAFT